MKWSMVHHKAITSSNGERPRKISPGPLDLRVWANAGDDLFYRGGVDLSVFGSARTPGGRPASRVDVTIQVGSHFRHTVAVFGHRIWEKKGRGLSASPPSLFESIPLTLTHAFGGKDEWDELPIPFPDNPDGIGYYLSEESATGKPLPHIEDPQHLIQHWDDRPAPVGMGLPPLLFGPRLRNSLIFNEESGMLRELKPTYFNTAFPAMIVPRVKPGDLICLNGATPDRPLEFMLPLLRLRVRLQFGQEVAERPLPIDQIGVDVAKKRVWITYCYWFRYKLIPLQKRSCEQRMTLTRDPRSVPLASQEKLRRPA
jgi:hypothetical protein